MSKPAKYRKPSWEEGREISAVQWDGDDTGDFCSWQYADSRQFNDVKEIPKAVKHAVKLGSPWRPSILIRTQAGDARVEPGDWIVRGVSGKLCVVKAEVFERTYIECH
jgi:hypothetical protein